jgi:hypothetical protein
VARDRWLAPPTFYELNVAGRTDFARHRRNELPSVEQNLEMYRAARQFLHASGYRQVTSCDWERVEEGAAGSHSYETLSRAVFRQEPDGRISGHDVWLGVRGADRLLRVPTGPRLGVHERPARRRLLPAARRGALPGGARVPVLGAGPPCVHARSEIGG